AATEFYTLSLHDALPIFVGQIMEYAANAEGSWGAGRLRQLASEYWAKAPRGKDLDAVLRAAFPEIDDVEAFWEQVEANLKQGRRSEEHTSELQSRFDLVC